MVPKRKFLSLTRAQGFTLVEILLSLGLGSLLYLTVVSMGYQMVKFQKTLATYNTIQATAILLVNQMRDDLRWSETVEPQFTGGNLERIVMTNNVDKRRFLYAYTNNKLTRAVDEGLTGAYGMAQEMVPDELEVVIEEIADIRTVNSLGSPGDFPLLRVRLRFEHISDDLAIQVPLEFTISSMRRKF